MDTALKAGFALATVGVVIAGGYGAYLLLKKNGGRGPGPGNGDCETHPAKLISIDEIDARPEGLLFWVFDVSYRNTSCENQSFVILMQVEQPDGTVITIQHQEMTLSPGQAGGFEWRFIFLVGDREIGKNKVSFFVWQNEITGVPVGKTKSIII